MKKIFRWLLRIGITFTCLAIVILSIAYWNRDRFFRMIEEELNAGIKGKLTIEKIDFTFFHNFPNFSITLHNVHLRPDRFEQYPHDIFFARKIFADIRLMPLLHKEIQVKALTVSKTKLFIFRTKDGYVNADIFKTDDHPEHMPAKQKSSLVLQLSKLNLRDVSVVYYDSLKNKFFGFSIFKINQTINHSDSIYSFDGKGSMHVDSLMFNAAAGSFMKNTTFTANLLVKVNTIEKVITVEPSDLNLNTSTIEFSGRFELQKERRYFLKFTSSNAAPEETIPLLNKKLARRLASFSITSPLNVTVSLRGSPADGATPKVDVLFETRNTALKYKTFAFTGMSVKGMFTNHNDSARGNTNANSKLAVTSFNGVMQNVPVQGHITFTALDDPLVDIFVKTKLQYTHLNDYINTNRILLKNGSFTSSIRYTGKLEEYLDSTRTRYNGKLKGSLSAKDVSLYYKPKKMLIDEINTICDFNEKKITIHSISLNLNGSAIQMKGSMVNFIPFFIRPKNKGLIKLSITSDDLNLTPFAARTKREKKSLQSKQSQKKITDLFDLVYHTLEFDLDLNVKNLGFRTFNATDVKGKITLFNNTLKAYPVSMKMAGGVTSLNFTLSKLFDPVSPMAIDLKVNDADIKTLFTTFNNFNQTTIEAENLAGTISANVKFSALIDDRYTIVAPTMTGTLLCKIKDGVLTDFEPIQNMSNFLFKKRDFSNVQFAELNSNFSVKGTDIHIKKMEIQSSVLSMFLQGHYSFADSTSLSVQLPLSNLKKRHKNFKPENIGVDAKAGPSVFLHVYRDKDVNSKMSIAYDPFKKWVKFKGD